MLVAEGLARFPADDRSGIEAVEGRLQGIDEHAVAVAVGGADHGRHGIDDLGEAFAAVAQHLLARALAVLKLALEMDGATHDDELLLAHFQEVARAGEKLVVVHRALQEVSGAGLERAQAVAALLIDRDHHHRHVGAGGNRAEAAGELGAIEIGHLVVGDDEIGDVMIEPGKRLERIAEGANVGTLFDRSGELREDVPIGDSVVKNDDQRHDADFPGSRAAVDRQRLPTRKAAVRRLACPRALVFCRTF